MVKSVVLDAGILGLLTNPKRSETGEACAKWLQLMINGNCPILVPEITDYEIRRELLRANKINGLRRLDSFISSNAVVYLPIDTTVMRQAALLWAEARQLRSVRVAFALAKRLRQHSSNQPTLKDLSVNQIKAGHKIELQIPDAGIGDAVEVLFILADRLPTKQQSILTMIDTMHRQQPNRTAKNIEQQIQ